VLIFAAIGMTVVALAHMLPVSFVLDWMAGERGIWRMPHRIGTHTRSAPHR
jgi:hypothetical protein